MEHVDPYASCERGRCNHDLARAVGIAELWGDDGPFAIARLVPGTSARRGALFDDDEQPYEPNLVAEQQRWAV